MSESAKEYRERGEADLAAADAAILPSTIEQHRRSALRWFDLYERRAQVEELKAANSKLSIAKA